MKFQPRKIVTLFVVAALSLSIAGIVAATPVDPCTIDRSSAEVSCDPCTAGKTSAEMGCVTPEPPTPTPPTPTPPPYDPCAPTSITAMGMGCETPTPPPYDPCAPTSITAQISCPSPTPDPTEAPAAPAAATPEPVVNYEENVSFNDADLGVSLFKAEDANGNVKMDLFHTDTGSSTSSYLFSITQEDIAPYMAEHPTENTLLASAEGVSVYVLTTGEIQINAGPDAEGKTHVKIFNGIPWTQVYGYTIDAE